MFLAPQCAALRCPWVSDSLLPVVHVPSCARLIGRSQMTWGRALENALNSKVGILKEFGEWIAIAKDRSKWRQLAHSIPKLLMPDG